MSVKKRNVTTSRHSIQEKLEAVRQRISRRRARTKTLWIRLLDPRETCRHSTQNGEDGLQTVLPDTFVRTIPRQMDFKRFL